MKYEAALKLSAALADAHISHTLHFGYHDNLAPPEQARVDVFMPRRYSGGLGAAIAKLEEIGQRHGVVLTTNFMGDGLTYSTPDRTPGTVLLGAES